MIDRGVIFLKYSPGADKLGLGWCAHLEGYACVKPTIAGYGASEDAAIEDLKAAIHEHARLPGEAS